MTFELYCVEIENIPYYNFLSPEEYESVHNRYEDFLERLEENENEN